MIRKLISWPVLNIIFLVLIFISSLAYIFYISNPALYYHLHQPAFLFDKSFIFPYLNKFNGLSQVLTLFTTQFFYNTLSGTIVLGLYGLILFFIINIILKRIAGSNKFVLLGFVPFILLIAALNNYFFPFELAVGLLITIILVYIQSCFNKSFFYASSSFLITAVIVYFLAGSGFLLVFSITSFIIFCKQQKMRENMIFAFIAIFLNFTIPYLSFKYVNPISPSGVFFYFVPKREFLVYDSKFYYLFCFSFPIVILIAKLFAIENIKKLVPLYYKILTSIKISALFIAILILSVFFLKVTFNKQMKNKIAVDYYTYMGEWEKALTSAFEAPKYDYSINVNYNRCIDQMGRFGSDFFNYPQLSGQKSLFPDYDFKGENSFICTDYYYDLGYISEARHWAYESLVYFPYSKRAMESLVLIHLINHEYSAAGKYLSLLSKEIGTKEFVQKYEVFLRDTSLIGKNPEFAEKRKYMPAAIELPESFAVRMINLLEKDGFNKRAYEHLLMYDLCGKFFDDFQSLIKFYTHYYTQIPQIFEQGIIIYHVLNKKPLDKSLKISENTFNQFRSFNAFYLENRENPDNARKVLYEKFGNTYFFYIRFVSQLNEKKQVPDKKKNEPII